MIFHYFACKIFSFIDKIDNNGWYLIPEWTPFCADYIKLWKSKSRQPSSATIQRRMGMDRPHEDLRPAAERRPGVGHNLYGAAYAPVISRRAPPFVRSWLIVSTEYFQDEFIIIFAKNDTTQ